MHLAARALCTLLASSLGGSLAACEAGPGAPSPAPGASAASASVTTKPPEPPPPPPADLDVAALEKALSCSADGKVEGKTGACRVLAAMRGCAPWQLTIPSGDGRFLGRLATVEGGKERQGFAVLRAARVNVSEIGPGQLLAKLVLVELQKTEGEAHQQADRALRAFERGDVPPKGSPAIAFADRLTTPPDVFLTRTEKGHVYGLSQGGLFVCQGDKQRLWLVRRAATRAGQGEGVYAELFPTSW